MSSDGATSTKSGVGKAKAPKSVSRSTKAGIEFPVGRVARYLKRGKYSERIGAGAPVYLSAVLEYLAVEVMDVAGTVAKDLKKKRITPTHIHMAMTTDEDLDQIWKNVIIPNAGIQPRVHKALLPNDEKKVYDKEK